VSLTVDLEGLQDRIAAVPVPGSNYFNITALWDRNSTTTAGDQRPGNQAHALRLDKEKETELGDFGGFEGFRRRQEDARRRPQRVLDHRLPTSKIRGQRELDLAGLTMDS